VLIDEEFRGSEDVGFVDHQGLSLITVVELPNAMNLVVLAAPVAVENGCHQPHAKGAREDDPQHCRDGDVCAEADAGEPVGRPNDRQHRRDPSSAYHYELDHPLPCCLVLSQVSRSIGRLQPGSRISPVNAADRELCAGQTGP
jgi:hypothetical protein